MKRSTFYRCEVCGNIVVKAVDGGGTLSCCGQPMKVIEPNTTDAAQEKHVPVATVEGDKIVVNVGSVDHPMEEAHFIQWVYVVTEEGVLATAANENGVAMIELLCESAPVAGNPEFLQLAQDIANVYLEKGGQTAEEVMGNASPSKEGLTLQEQMEELYNRIREVFRLNRFTRLEGNGAAYVHHNKKVGVIIATEGKNEEAAKDVCMHAAAMHPEYLNRDQIPAEVIAKEREIQLAAMANDPKNAGKPESILNKIIDGKINAFYKANCLVDQEFVKDSSLSVGAYAKNNVITVTQYVNWTLGAK